MLVDIALLSRVGLFLMNYVLCLSGYMMSVGKMLRGCTVKTIIYGAPLNIFADKQS